MQFPVLYSGTLLFIRSIYNSLHLLIPISQSILLLLSLPLGNHRSVLYVCEFVSVSQISSAPSGCCMEIGWQEGQTQNQGAELDGDAQVRDDIDRLGEMALEMHRWGGRRIWEEVVNVRVDQQLKSHWELRHTLTDFWTPLCRAPVPKSGLRNLYF